MNKNTIEEKFDKLSHTKYKDSYVYQKTLLRVNR